MKECGGGFYLPSGNGRSTGGVAGGSLAARVNGRLFTRAGDEPLNDNGTLTLEWDSITLVCVCVGVYDEVTRIK